MPRKCTVCVHPATAEASKSLTRGDSISSVALRYGLTEAAVQRHLRNCLRIVRRVEKSGLKTSPNNSSDPSRFETEPGPLDGPLDSPAALLKRLERLFRIGSQLDKALERGDVDAICKLAREYRATHETYAKLAGWLTDGSATNVLIDRRQQVIAVLAGLTTEELRANVAAGDATLTQSGTEFREQISLAGQ